MYRLPDAKMRTVVAIFTGLPLFVLVLNLLTNTPPPTRKLRVVVATAPPRRVSPPPPPDASPPPSKLPVIAVAPFSDSCDNGTAHVELWGSLILAGTDNEQATAANCCRSCREYEPTLDVNGGAQCNTWVYNPSSRACWLKNQRPEELPRASARLAKGPGDPRVPWHSGVWMGIRPCADCIAPKEFNGCIGKDRCNTSRACGSPASMLNE